MKLTEDTLRQAASILDERIGLKPDASFRPRLARAFRDAAAAHGLDQEQLVAVLAKDPRMVEELIDRVTVQETAFFRHPEQFETLRRDLMPTLDRPLCAWSAAASNGQEAYSLAMLVRDAAGTGSVLATDISVSALERARAGLYSTREMIGVSERRRARYFTPRASRWEVDADIRAMVTVRRHNLLDAIPPEVAQCQIVFCRNVLIYFGQLHAARFLNRLADVMAPTAYLFLGAAETLWHVDKRFEAVRIGGTYVYRVRPPQLHSVPRSPSEPDGARANRARALLIAAGSTIDKRPAGAAITPLLTARHAVPKGSNQPDFEQVGRSLISVGDVDGAIVEFRKWVYASPDDPAAHFQLGAAFDSSGDQAAAARAYRSALLAVDRGDPMKLATLLEGYDPSELRRLLVQRSAAPDSIPVAQPTSRAITKASTTR